MKKQLRRTLSIIVSMVLAVSAFSSGFGASAAIYSDNPLDEWIEMADALKAEGKAYTVGASAFDEAYDNLLYLKSMGATDSETINSAIDALKTAWNGLAVSEVTEAAPNGGVENDTGFAGFGKKYISKTDIKRFEISYNLGKPGADYWKDVNRIYVYAYAYNNSDEISESIGETSLPKGTNKPNINYVRLVLDNKSLNWPGIKPLTNGSEVFLSANTVNKFEFTNESIVSKFTAEGNLIFKQPSDCSENINAYIGSLFIERLEYETAPVSYELFNWVRRAEKLLANGKTYTDGLDSFKSAVSAAKAETDAAKAAEHIEAIKAAWRALKYENAEIIAYPKAQSSTDITNETDGLESGWLAVKSKGKIIETRFDTISGAAGKIAASDKVYFSIRGYQIADTSKRPELNWTTINLNSSSLYYGAGPSVETYLKKFEFDKDTLSSKLNGAELSTILLKQGGYNAESVWIVSPIYAVTYGTEQLPPDRLLIWAERAEELLSDSSKTFTAGLDSFEAIIAEIYAADDTADADALIARLKNAWNNLEYDETFEIAYPQREGGTLNEEFVPADGEKELFGDRYVQITGDNKLQVGFLSSNDEYCTKEWLSGVKEIYFYARGYKADSPDTALTKNWSGLTIFDDTKNEYLFSGPNFTASLKKFVAKQYPNSSGTRVEMTMAEKMNELGFDSFTRIVMAQGDKETGSVWEVGSMFAVKSSKAHIADYGDVNDDGNTDILDLVRAKKYFAGADVAISEYALDINDDNYLKAEDLASVRKLLLNGTVYSDNQVSDGSIF